MALFSILHLWAYPWKPYDIDRSSIVTAENGAGYPPDKSSYKGGKFGHRAFLDAFNPWDLVKAVGRGFRWVAVGRKHREQDVSYEPHLQQGTALQNPVGIMGGKAGKYERLTEEDDVERPGSFSDELRYAHPAPYSGATGPVPYASQGDLGGAHYADRKQGYMDDRTDERTLMPGRIRENGGFQAPPSTESRRPAPSGAFGGDTGYHGAEGFGGGVEMPDPAQWTGHAR